MKRIVLLILLLVVARLPAYQAAMQISQPTEFQNIPSCFQSSELGPTNRNVLAPDPRLTFRDVLGKEKIDGIVEQVISEFVKKENEDTQATPSKLPGKQISHTTLPEAEQFPKKKEGETPGPTPPQLPGKKAGERPAPGPVEPLAGAEKKRRIEVSPSFNRAATRLIYGVETSLDKVAAEKKLREGFAVFLTNYSKYVQKGTTEPRLLITDEQLKAYTETTQKCGEIPCKQPPCCKDCDSCK